jgi:hypothetical protein
MTYQLISDLNLTSVDFVLISYLNICGKYLIVAGGIVSKEIKSKLVREKIINSFLYQIHFLYTKVFVLLALYDLSSMVFSTFDEYLLSLNFVSDILYRYPNIKLLNLKGYKCEKLSISGGKFWNAFDHPMSGIFQQKILEMGERSDDMVSYNKSTIIVSHSPNIPECYHAMINSKIINKIEEINTGDIQIFAYGGTGFNQSDIHKNINFISNQYISTRINSITNVRNSRTIQSFNRSFNFKPEISYKTEEKTKDDDMYKEDKVNGYHIPRSDPIDIKPLIPATNSIDSVNIKIYIEGISKGVLIKQKSRLLSDIIIGDSIGS